MKLNSIRNIKLCSQGLYARQLSAYANLCKIYSDLAAISGKHSPQSVEHKYANVLSKAAQGDLSFLDKNTNFVSREDYIGPLYSDSEAELFKKYSEYSQLLQTYKTGLIKLEKALSDGSKRHGNIDESLIEDYHNFMQSPNGKSPFVAKSAKSYDSFVNNGSSRYIGHRNFMIVRNSVAKISDIDENHITIPNFSERATPERYGATLKGKARSLTHRDLNFVVNTADQTFSDYEAQTYGAPITPARENLEKVIVAGNKIGASSKRFYTKNRTAIRKTFAATLAVATLLSGAKGIMNAHELNNLSITEHAQYEQTVSNETKDKLTLIRQSIENFQKSSDTPTQEQIYQIRDDLDGVIDDVVSDLVTTAFEEAMPGCTVQSVDTSYDHSDPETNGEKCDITYIDAEGRQHTTSITNFSTVLFAENPMSTSFENEYNLDHRTPGTINSIYNPHSTNNFVEKSEDIYSMLDYYMQVLEDAEHLAGTKIELKDGMFLGLRLKTTLPDKTNNNPEQTSPTGNFHPVNDPLARFENNNDDGR